MAWHRKGRPHPATLFLKVACVVVAGVLLVAAFTLGAALRTTEQGYIETLRHSNEEILLQVQSDMEQMNDAITDAVLMVNNSWVFRQYLTGDANSPAAFRRVYEMMKQVENIRPTGRFYDMAAVGVNGNSFVSNGKTLAVPVKELLAQDFTREASQRPNNILYCFVDKGITSGSGTACAMLAVKALTYPGTQTPYGFVYVVLKQQDLQDFYGRLGNQTNNLLLLAPDGTVVSSSDSAQIGGKEPQLAAALEEMQRAGQGSRRVEIDGKSTEVLLRTMERWGLRLVCALDLERALHEMDSRGGVVWVCLLVSAAVLLCLFLFLRQVTRPIYALAGRMESVAKGGVSAAGHVTVKGGYEAQRLATAFNRMIDDLGTYMDRLVAMEKEKRQTEIQALQMQIQPHFIYNTLASIKWLIWQQEPGKAVQCIDAFSMLLRNTIGNSTEIITAQQEVENLKNYAFLQRIRFGEHIRVDFLVEPDARACCIPKLLLQPFLENAFFYAFPDQANGVISVFLSCHGDTLVCEIMDNGVGMTREQVERLRAPGWDSADKLRKNHFSGIGIGNVNDRIHLLYGPDYGVQIFSTPGRGTTVRVKIPVQRKPENKK